ncbi:WD40 repeat-containing protein [Cryptosporidium ubiquitum]|uniref:WD40 repeat-containing protein n=1 Tax=Cryptosporidium ubiquitum TaxID=857276 RepID=A0A1J4MRF6_9CRYT|nr:WD40 repeat-containing protein [Cryptosporidium ubiquitum]OII75477.1 WD40 repeat-containing protein [Cryptosporidium ubiquitum]
MNKGYKGGCFSLKVPPVFCKNGNLLLIPKGRNNEINVYDTLGNGESRSQFSASKEVITGFGVIKSNHKEELIITTTFNGLIRIFTLHDVLNHMEKPLMEFRITQCILDLKIAKNNIYLLTGEAKGEDTVLNPNVSLYKIVNSDIFSRLNSDNNKTDSKFAQKFLKKMIDFSYGALSFQVSFDESIFCFIWKNILLIWNIQYPNQIIRFRHSEYILSLIISEDKQFVATGDAYGRLTYWFIPPSSSKEGIQMWENAPSISENSDIEKMIYKYNVKTSISHWHSHELTCLNIIPGTDVILSGGEEAVLVLWRQTFSSDSYLIHSRNQLKNSNNNGTRQFIPRLGAPIYTITPFKKERVQNDTQNTDYHQTSESIPSLIAAIVCSDNSIKIIDLVHNKIINTIYGISTPFNIIKGSVMDYPQMKIIPSYFFNPTRLLVSIIGHPFKLHIHDLIKDLWYSSIFCKPEESYVSKVGEGISSSKLVQDDVTRVLLVDAYYSKNAKFAITIESQTFDHMKNQKKVYNFKFWRILISKERTHFELVSKYHIAHTDQVISIEEAKSENPYIDDYHNIMDKSNFETETNNTCFITTTSKREIKCWVYKKEVKEWVNSSIIHGESDIEVYSTCFSDEFNKLFLASSKGIIIYNWNKQHSVLLESDLGYLSLKGNKISQMVTIMHMNEYYLLALSTFSKKLFVWNITSMELILEQNIDLNFDSKLITTQNFGKYNKLMEEIPFQFAIIRDKNKGKISLYKFEKNIKSKSNKSRSEIKLTCLKDIEVDLLEKTSIKDAIIQPKVENSKICLYLVLLLSSCDVYIQEVGVLDRSDIVSQVLNNINVQPETSEKTPLSIKGFTDESHDITDIQESIEKMFLTASKDDQIKDEKESHVVSTLSKVSKTVQNIISYSNDSSNKGLVIDQAVRSFSSLYCLRQNSTEVLSFGKKNLKNLSQSLNTCMCPSPSNLFWTLFNSNSTNLSRLSEHDNDHNTNSKHHKSSYVQVFDSKDTNKLDEYQLSSSKNSFDQMNNEILISESLKPLQTQKLQSMLKKATFSERK